MLWYSSSIVCCMSLLSFFFFFSFVSPSSCDSFDLLTPFLSLRDEQATTVLASSIECKLDSTTSYSDHNSLPTDDEIIHQVISGLSPILCPCNHAQFRFPTSLIGHFIHLLRHAGI